MATGSRGGPLVKASPGRGCGEVCKRGRARKFFSGVLTAGAIRVECIIRRPLVVVDDERVGGLLFDNLVASAKRIPFCLVPGL